MQQTILITGANGYIGSYLVNFFLVKNFHVKAFVHTSSHNLPTNNSLTILKGDIRDPIAVKKAASKVDFIIHLAAAKSDERNSQSINIGGTQNILNQERAKRIIIVSTLSAKLPNPGLYGKTKAEADKISLKYKNAIILRPSIVYSNDLKGVFGSIVKATNLPFVPVFGSGETIFAPILLDDLAKAIAILLDAKKINHKIYDIGGNQKIMFKDLIKQIAFLHQKKVVLLHLPAKLGLLIAKLFSFLPKPPITKSNILGSNQNVEMDIKTFQNEFNFIPSDLNANLKNIFDPYLIYIQKEAKLLLCYIASTFTPHPQIPPKTIENYIKLAITRKIDQKIYNIYFFPPFLAAADITTKLFFKNSYLQKKLYAACAILECSAQSANWLLPKRHGLISLLKSFVLIGFTTASYLLIGLLMLPIIVYDEKRS